MAKLKCLFPQHLPELDNQFFEAGDIVAIEDEDLAAHLTSVPRVIPRLSWAYAEPETNVQGFVLPTLDAAPESVAPAPSAPQNDVAPEPPVVEEPKAPEAPKKGRK